ncbi:MAG: hypothetical protein J1F12_04350 [Muribaculaceae bacterium]|nr:hypothetical protein [Muribaculaceae bacterium]
MNSYQENINEIDDIKIMWQEINLRLGHLEEENKRLARKVLNSDYKSARERLINKYAIFVGVEIFMLFVMSAFFYFNPEIVEKYRWPVLIYWALFFLGEVMIDFYLMHNVKNIDIYNSSVTQISKIAATNWKIHKLAVIIGLPIAIGAVILFALAMDSDEVVIFGMITGGIIGLIIGTTQLLKFSKYYRLLQNRD